MNANLNDKIVVGIIPARFASTRFPGKLLKTLKGKTVIRHVWEKCVKAQTLSRVIVATDDQRIKNEVLSFGGEVFMTSSEHQTGTDRIAEVSYQIEADLIVNIQGDEPLIRPEVIDSAVKPLLKDPLIKMGTIASVIKNDEELNDPNVVKVIMDSMGFAIYFSRLPIPFVREKCEERKINRFKHIGLYVYQKEFLQTFSKLPVSVIEGAEKLEQLRAIENGYKIKVVETDYDSIGIDTPEDLEKALKLLV